MLRVNDVVPDDFIYKVGVKLGMVVFTESGPNYDEESLGNKMQIEQLSEIIGNPGDCVIFTGKIVYVGEEHIEHDLNAFGGFWWADGHLFLLVKDHKDHQSCIIGVGPRCTEFMTYSFALAVERRAFTQSA